MASCCISGVVAAIAPMMDPLDDGTTLGRSRRPRLLCCPSGDGPSEEVAEGLEVPYLVGHGEDLLGVRLFVWSVLRTPWSTNRGAKCVRSAALSCASTSLNMNMLSYRDEHNQGIQGRSAPTFLEAITAGVCHNNMCCLQAITALPSMHDVTLFFRDVPRCSEEN